MLFIELSTKKKEKSIFVKSGVVNIIVLLADGLYIVVSYPDHPW